MWQGEPEQMLAAEATTAKASFSLVFIVGVIVIVTPYVKTNVVPSLEFVLASVES